MTRRPCTGSTAGGCADIFPTARQISLSRRDLPAPGVRVTRFSRWTHEVNPWADVDRLPVLDRGLFSDLVHAGRPRIIDDLAVPGRRSGRPIPGRPAVAPGDPAVRRRGRGQHGRPHPRGAGRLPTRAVPRAGVDEQPVRPGHAHRTSVAEAEGRPRAGPAGDAAGRQAPAQPAADRPAEGLHPRPGRLLADDGRGRRRLLQRSPAAPRPGRAAARRRLRARGRPPPWSSPSSTRW